jgi:hypothetical protein
MPEKGGAAIVEKYGDFVIMVRRFLFGANARRWQNSPLDGGHHLLCQALDRLFVCSIQHLDDEVLDVRFNKLLAIRKVSLTAQLARSEVFMGALPYLWRGTALVYVLLERWLQAL